MNHAACADLSYNMTFLLLYVPVQQFGATVLHNACISGNLDLVKFLIETMQSGYDMLELEDGVRIALCMFWRTCTL
jgi:hypothetical protein